jgi:glycosyltransferase involved in cell wall biosynthesis
MPRARRKLLIVSSSLGEGGAQRVTSTLLTHLSPETLELRLCLFKPVIDYALPEVVSVTSLLDGDASLGSQPWLIPVALLRLRREIAATRPDVVLSMIDQVNLLTAAALTGLPRRPRWIARAGSNPACQTAAQRSLARWAYRRADAIIANAAGLGRRIAELYPDVAARIVHLPNPIDFDHVDRLAAADPRPRDPSRPVLVFVGRLVKEKRPDLLIDAAAELARRRRFVLQICGDGPLAGDLRRQIRALGLDDSVEMLGFQSNPYAIVARADVFVMTSQHEGLPNALIEAQGLGIPAVSSRCPFGPEEIIDDGETGRLVAVGDPLAVADAVDELLADERLRAEMGRTAAARIRARYSVQSLVGRWEKLLAGGDLDMSGTAR